jgi:hypothetical protein
MDDKDTEQISEHRGRKDDRNELAEGSPVPDPEDEGPGSDDMPEAD